jgi:hypothetical protein
MAGGAAAGAAAAAAAHRRQEEEEEEHMATYSDKELSEGWEFKILRSNTRAFRQPENLKAILEEEGRAGWILVEKFDDGRIRLKRPATARQADSELGFDPYRTRVGISDAGLAFTILAIVFGSVALIILGAAVVYHMVSAPQDAGKPPPKAMDRPAKPVP